MTEFIRPLVRIAGDSPLPGLYYFMDQGPAFPQPGLILSDTQVVPKKTCTSPCLAKVCLPKSDDLLLLRGLTLAMFTPSLGGDYRPEAHMCGEGQGPLSTSY